MGVPGLFAHLTRKNPNLVSTKIKNRSPSLVCLDFNCAIHYCNAKLKKSWDWENGTKLGYEASLIAFCENYIDQIVDQFDNIGILFVSIDGVPPNTKIIQQRRRRYLSSFMRSKTENTDDWDSNAISPGTAFMQNLNERLTTYVHASVNQYIFSDSNEPGEGETKIFDYLTQKQFGCAYIYGLDADLIMLSLLLKDQSVYLMRESQYFHKSVTEPFVFLDIPLLADDIKRYMRSMFDSDHIVSNYIETYVLLSMLVGNDFVPPLSYLKIRSNSIEFLLKTLASVIKFGVGDELIYCTDGDWKINWMLMTPLLTALSGTEQEGFQRVNNEYFANDRKFHTDEDRLNFYGIANKPDAGLVDPNKDGWRNRYYKALFGSERIENICKNFVEGLLWNVDYYMNKKVSTRWHYKYDYGPLLFDLSNFVTIHSDLDRLKPEQINTFLSPGDHLMSILPIQSHHMLEEEDRRIASNIENVRFFPSTFKIQTYLKTYLHECCPQIPPMKMF